MVKILPSLASADQLCLKSEIEKVKFTKHLHFDIEDGNFVPNITFGMKTIRRACTILEGVEYDAHLMVTDPLDYIDELGALGFAAVAFHWENAPYPLRIIRKIQGLGMKAGIALNPRTAAEEIQGYLSEADYFLLMSSEPDGAGERFQPNVLPKIRFLRNQAEKKEIIVDGGINEENYQSIIDAGADGIVLGRAIFQSEAPRTFIEDLVSQSIF